MSRGSAVGRGPARLMALCLAGALVVAIVLQPGSPPVADAAEADPDVVISGRGWGHGRGMSQYGAYGYARDYGWTSAEILNHYYGGTTGGPAPNPGVVDPDHMRVDLVYMRGRATTVGLTTGTIELFMSDGTVVGSATGAVRVTVDGSATNWETAPSCDGPWTDNGTLVNGDVRIRAALGGPTDQSGLLHVCGPSYTTWYEGEIWVTRSSTGSQRTVNPVSVEQYLRGVVPNEVPASWSMAALEAQAIAARSYVLAGDTRWSSYAETCDSTLCQVYDGRFTTRGGTRTSTHSRTDTAIATTTGIVRLFGNGSVARTEFSSSSGGYTVAGDFPAVEDIGDAVSANPNSSWEVTVDLDDFESSYNHGALLGMAVVERNGLGADGGRVLEARFYFEDETVSLDGDQVRRAFGLKSNWFRFAPLRRDGAVVTNVDLESANRFVDQAFRRIEGRAPTGDELDRWVRRLRTGQRITLADELVHGDQYAGTVIDELYLSAFNRGADAGGRQYWVAEMADGLKYEHLGTLFYGSPEYVMQSGNTNETFVDALYGDLLGRQADSSGRAYWLGLLADGRATPADVANAFYVSIESRRDRAQAVHNRVLGAAPSAARAEEHAARLLQVDDLTLAAELATELGALDD
ncbi:MAG: SpoIID/LytB domain-containing protein [Actinomycetota bacterium]